MLAIERIIRGMPERVNASRRIAGRETAISNAAIHSTRAAPRGIISCGAIRPIIPNLMAMWETLQEYGIYAPPTHCPGGDPVARRSANGADAASVV